MKLRVRLKEVLEERGITQKQLVEMTGLRAAAISELVNNQRQSIKKEHLEKIAKALNITRVEELLEFVETDD